MNELKLIFWAEHIDDAELRNTTFICSRLTVDEHQLIDQESDMLHLDELVNSIYGYGPFEIYTCSCGTAECFGIWEDITVSQEDNLVLWTVPKPLVTQDEDCADYDYFVFDKVQYRQAIKEGLNQALKLCSDYTGCIEIEPYGFTVKNLKQLSVDPPATVIDRRAEKKTRTVCHGPALVEGKYLYRVIKEEDANQRVNLWVEGWDGAQWTRNFKPSISMNTALKSPPAPDSILTEANVPDEDFPSDYKLPGY